MDKTCSRSSVWDVEGESFLYKGDWGKERDTENWAAHSRFESFDRARSGRADADGRRRGRRRREARREGGRCAYVAEGERKSERQASVHPRRPRRLLYGIIRSPSAANDTRCQFSSCSRHGRGRGERGSRGSRGHRPLGRFLFRPPPVRRAPYPPDWINVCRGLRRSRSSPATPKQVVWPRRGVLFWQFRQFGGDRVINDAWRAVDLPPVSKARREKGAGAPSE